MEQFLEWLGKHFQWIFSGIGVALLFAFWKARKSPVALSQRLRGGAFSRNVQVGIVQAADRNDDGQ